MARLKTTILIFITLFFLGGCGEFNDSSVSSIEGSIARASTRQETTAVHTDAAQIPAKKAHRTSRTMKRMLFGF